MNKSLQKLIISRIDSLFQDFWAIAAKWRAEHLSFQGRCRPKLWKPTEFPGKESDLFEKTHLEVMRRILLEMLHVGLELTCWSWLVILWTTSLYRPIHQLCIPVYDSSFCIFAFWWQPVLSSDGFIADHVYAEICTEKCIAIRCSMIACLSWDKLKPHHFWMRILPKNDQTLQMDDGRDKWNTQMLKVQMKLKTIKM